MLDDLTAACFFLRISFNMESNIITVKIKSFFILVGYFVLTIKITNIMFVFL